MAEYRLCLATQQIAQAKLAQPVKSVPIPAGKHRLELRQDSTSSDSKTTLRTLVVELDGKPHLNFDETYAVSHMAAEAGDFSKCRQVRADEPIVLYRRRYGRNDGSGTWTTPTEPCEGILLWIEPVRGAKE